MVNLGSELEQALALFQLIHLAMFELLKNVLLFFVVVVVCLFVFLLQDALCSNSLLYCMCDTLYV